MRTGSDRLPGNELLLNFLGVVSAVPLISALQAFFELNRGFVAENVSRTANFGLRVANIAIARRFVLGLNILAGNFPEQFESMVQRNAGTGTDVENFAAGTQGFASK